jgi:hypothetical protein
MTTSRAISNVTLSISLLGVILSLSLWSVTKNLDRIADAAEQQVKHCAKVPR